MNYIQAHSITKAYGEKVLFSNISISIARGEKVALIARNGTGKTTLLNILGGNEEPDAGHCTRRSGLRIACLPQDPVFLPGATTGDALLSADNPQTRAIRAYEEFVSDPRNIEGARERATLQQLTERVDALQAWDYEHRVRQVLSMLRINNLKAKIGSLSGGQQKRVALARILIEDADLLLLDEPTNHLDIPMIEWLEGFLERRKATLLMVTHDRYFLDAVCNRIIELENDQMHAYTGNYAYFLEKKQERKDAELSQNEKALNLLRREKEWMHRSPPARTTKSKARKQAYEELKQRTETTSEKGPGAFTADMTRMGKKVLELQNVHKTFGETTVLQQFSYVFRRGERIGIAGPNGTGKSTLLNCIAGTLKPDAGKIITGETIRFGYFRQEGIPVAGDKKVIEVVTDTAERIRTGDNQWMSAARFLRYFNFPNHMHHNRVSSLSGGERRKLYLLSVLMQNPNFLILDEPTNDLDIDTLNVLEEFLNGFPGCLLIVSHDRYFLDRLSDQLFVFRGAGNVTIHPGNYTEYRQQELPGTKAGKKSGKGDRPEKKERIRKKTKRSYKEQREFEALEAEIDALEKEKDKLLASMNSGKLSPEELRDASGRFQEAEKLLGIKGDRWLELSEIG